MKRSLPFYTWFAVFSAVLMVVAFVSGLAMPKEGSLTLAAHIAQLVPGVVQVQGAGDIPSANDLKPLATFWEVRDQLIRKYVKPISDDRSLTYGAIRGMLAALNDPFTRFMTPDEYGEFQKDTNGEFSGIGAILSQQGPDDERDPAAKPVAGAEPPGVPAVAKFALGDVYIVSVIPEGPAAKKGLRPGDIILKVDGESTKNKSLQDVVTLIRGPEGKAVILTVKREKTPDPLDIEIMRAKVDVPVVESRMLDGKIGYVWLRSFNKLSYAKMQEAIGGLLDQGMKGLVFDLSSDGGGLLNEAVSIGGLFLPDQPIVYVQERGQEPQPYNSSGPALVPAKMPVVVMMDGGSASASEIVAGCLQDTGRASLVGYNSFGKASVQTVIELNDGSALVLTTAHYLTPKKRDISAQDAEGHRGLKPDLRLPEPDASADQSPEAWRDQMINRARQLVVEKVAAASGAPAG